MIACFPAYVICACQLFISNAWIIYDKGKWKEHDGKWRNYQSHAINMLLEYTYVIVIQCGCDCIVCLMIASDDTPTHIFVGLGTTPVH